MTVPERHASPSPRPREGGGSSSAHAVPDGRFEIASRPGTAGTGADDRLSMPSRVSDREVRAAVERGARSVAELARECGAGGECRGCRATLEALLEKAARYRPSSLAAIRGRLVVVAA